MGRIALTLVAAVVAAVVVVAAPTRASAQSSEEQARVHYRKGTQLYDLGRYLDAALEYETAFKLSDRAALLFNVGQAYRLAARKAEALAAYRGFVRRSPSSTARVEAEEHIATLERELATAPKSEQKTPPPPPPPSIERDGGGATIVRLPSAKPSHRRAWVWGTIGAVVVAGVALGVGLGVGLGSRSDTTILPTQTFP